MPPLKSFFERFELFYPYDQSSLSVKIKIIIRTIFIKIFNAFIYPDISLLDYFKELKEIKNNKEFLEQYNISTQGFDLLWEAKPRETQEQIEGFYSEHDRDVWRQVYLSKYCRHKRKYVLTVKDLISDYSKDAKIKILDYGCGCGIYSHYLSKKGYKDITLADIESSTFKFARDAFGEKFKYVKIDNPRPLTENYEVVLLIDCLAHAFDPFGAIEHVLEHLKKGGLLIIFYEREEVGTHVSADPMLREKTMNYIYDHCKCLKQDLVFIKL